MIKYSWHGLDRLESLFIEIIDYPLKKEILLYPICYCQLVRKTNSFDVELTRLISCANKTFKALRGSWQDIMAELNMFQIYSIEGNVYTGKDILKLTDTEGLLVTLLPEYRDNFNGLCSKLLKYWNILSRISTYGKRNIIAESVYISCLAFNEGLYEEVQLYINLNEEYFDKSKPFFKAVLNLSKTFCEVEKGIMSSNTVSTMVETIKYLEALPDVFYGVNIAKLRRDSERFMKDLQRRKIPEFFSIEFIKNSKNKGNIFKKLINLLKKKIGKHKNFRNINLMIKTNNESLCKGAV